jgi:hypothetical protein
MKPDTSVPAPDASSRPLPNSDLLASGMNLMQLPVILDLSSEGEVRGLVNAEEFGRMMDGIYEAMSKHPGPEGKPLSEEQKASLKIVTDRLRALPPEVQAGKIMGKVQNILDFSATELTVGDTVETEKETEGYLGGTLNYDVRITVDRTTSEALFLTSTQTASPEELKQYVDSVFSSAPPGIVADKAGFPEIVSQVIQTSYEVSRKDGLLRKFDSIETITVRSEGKTESAQRTEKIERLD